MKLLTCLVITVSGLLTAVSLPVADEELVVTPDYFPDHLAIYTAQYDIVKITTPLNFLNTKTDESDSIEIEPDNTLFFVQAEVQPDGTRQYKGLYVLKEGKAIKLLANGRDAAASGDESEKAFFGASDGLYVYNKKTNSADKYGPITDSIIAIEKERTGDVIYILTENHELYKVSDNGEKKEKLEDVVNAKQIVLDYLDNLYFIDGDNKAYVRNADGVKRIDDLPESFSNVRLVKPPSVLDDAAGLVADNRIYVLKSNGSSEWTEIEIDSKVKLTAYSPELSLIQYYALNKKIYEYNLLKMLLEAEAFVNGDLDNYLTSKGANVRAIAAQKKGHAAKKNKPLKIYF